MRVRAGFLIAWTAFFIYVLVADPQDGGPVTRLVATRVGLGAITVYVVGTAVVWALRRDFTVDADGFKYPLRPRIEWADCESISQSASRPGVLVVVLRGPATMTGQVIKLNLMDWDRDGSVIADSIYHFARQRSVSVNFSPSAVPDGPTWRIPFRS